MVAKQSSSLNNNFEKHEIISNQIEDEPLLHNKIQADNNLVRRVSTVKNLVPPKEPFKPVFAINPNIHPIYLVTSPNQFQPFFPQQNQFNPLMSPFNYQIPSQYVYYYPPIPITEGNPTPSLGNKAPTVQSFAPILPKTNNSSARTTTSIKEYPLALPEQPLAVPPIKKAKSMTNLNLYKSKTNVPLNEPIKQKNSASLFRYQKPTTVDGLKHPSDKYKDLIYKPKYITSRNIEPPTEELVPKYEEAEMDDDVIAPLMTFRSRYNFTPVSKKPILADNLKLPVESLKLPQEKLRSSRSHESIREAGILKPPTRKPTLVDDLKLPIEKVNETKFKYIFFIY